MPMMEPATAVAISQRKNSWPSVVDVWHRDAHYGLTGFFERRHRGILLRVWVRYRGARKRRRDRCRRPRARRALRDRRESDPFPSLPVDSASNCSSHAPRSEMPGEVMMVTLSRPCFCSVPRIVPSTTPGFSSAGYICAARLTISGVRLRNFATSTPMNRGRDHAEIRERGIAAADAGHAEENVAEVVALRHFLHLRTRIGDGDEAACRLLHADESASRGRRNIA